MYDLVFNVPLHTWGWYESAVFIGSIFGPFVFLFVLPTCCIELTDNYIVFSFYVGIGPLVLFQHERSAPWEKVVRIRHISFPLGWTIILADKSGPLWMKNVSILIAFGMVHRRNAMRFIRKKVPNEVLDSEFKSTWGESLKGE
jgi:hypothetical protein